MNIGRIREYDRVMAVCTELLHIRRGVLYIKVGSHSGFVLHKTQIPVWNIVIVEPLNGLTDCLLMEIFGEEPMRDDANANVARGKPPQACRSANHGLELVEELPLRNGKPVKGLIPSGSPINIPLGQTKGNVCGKRFNRYIEPFGSNETQ